MNWSDYTQAQSDAIMFRTLLSRILKFKDSPQYWQKRYQSGGKSGAGSYGRLAVYKAAFLNKCVSEYEISSVIEFGCGDGHQLSLAQYPCYTGFDISQAAIQLCLNRFSDDKTKSFFLYHPEAFIDRRKLFAHDAALSLDVIYHIVEDRLYWLYLEHLFACASRLVVIYASDQEGKITLPHVKHRKFTRDIAERFPEWALTRHEKNPYPYESGNADTSFADFFIYERR